MTPSEKFLNEKSELKENRINRILSSSFDLFAKTGIDTIVMTDIAKKAEIGVASLYRYFETKEEIAIRTAIWAWEQEKLVILPKIQNETYEKMNGLNQISVIFSTFTSIYEENPDFLRFIYFFDSYAVRQQISAERLADYENTIKYVQTIVANSISKGIQDKSINSSYKDSENILYFTIMHSLFSMAQKITLSGNLLEMDKKIAGKAEIELLASMLIKSLK